MGAKLMQRPPPGLQGVCNGSTETTAAIRESTSVSCASNLATVGASAVAKCVLKSGP